MLFLIEFPDVNTFFIDEPITTIPDFVARTDIKDGSVSYQIKWWYVNDPENFTLVSNQRVTFSNPSNDIDYICILSEFDASANLVETYQTDILLGYNFHVKILSSDISGYGRGEHESYSYSGYSGFNDNSGVVHKNEFKEDGISGYSGYSGVYLPVLNIIDSENVRLQKSYDDSQRDENLNPVYDDEQDTFSLYTKYGLDPTNITHQDLCNKIQKFEFENYSLYQKKSSMIRILKPIDDQMVRLYKRISELEKQSPIIEEFIAGENITKHQLVSLVDTDISEQINLTKVFRANAFTILEDEVTTTHRRCYGIALESVSENEICRVQIRGLIDEFNFWWDENFDFYETINCIYYLWEYGRMEATLFPDPDNITLEGEQYVTPVIYQEIGYPITENKFILDIKQPVVRNIIENCEPEPEEPGDPELPA